jgi:UDP:flavonoid glycosyltransferase YjiC (YdhE family)
LSYLSNLGILLQFSTSHLHQRIRHQDNFIAISAGGGKGAVQCRSPRRIVAVRVIEGVQVAGVRAIVSKGWSELAGPQDSNIFYIGDCPHTWLFQHVAAVVHHGGAGTTACGLLNGRPTTIVPFFGE